MWVPENPFRVSRSVQAVTEALLAAAQTTDVSTNTGGVRYRPPVAKQPAKLAKRKLLSAEQIVDRMRVSYPALRAAKVD